MSANLANQLPDETPDFLRKSPGLNFSIFPKNFCEGLMHQLHLHHLHHLHISTISITPHAPFASCTPLFNQQLHLHNMYHLHQLCLHHIHHLQQLHLEVLNIYNHLHISHETRKTLQCQHARVLNRSYTGVVAHEFLHRSSYTGGSQQEFLDRSFLRGVVRQYLLHRSSLPGGPLALVQKLQLFNQFLPNSSFQTLGDRGRHALGCETRSSRQIARVGRTDVWWGSQSQSFARR